MTGEMMKSIGKQNSKQALVRQRGSAMLGMAVMLSSVMGLTAYMIHSNAEKGMAGRQGIRDRMQMHDASMAATRRFVQLFEGGTLRISTETGSQGNITGDTSAFAAVGSGGTGWLREGTRQDKIYFDICSKTLLAPGESYDLPSGVASNPGCAAETRIRTTLEVLSLHDDGTDKFAKMRLNSDWTPEAKAAKHRSSGLTSMDMMFKLSAAGDGTTGPDSDLCPYTDPALNTAPAKYTQNFYVGGGRFHAGWIKLGVMHNYGTISAGTNTGFIGVSGFTAIPSNRSGHGWEWVTRSTSTMTAYNYEFGVSKGAGTWSHQSILYVPVADPASCYWWVGARRRAGFGSGCFAEGTQIKMADGSQRPIEMIRDGEKVWNPVLRRPVTVERITSGPEDAAMVRVTVAGHTVDVTSEHPFLTPSGLVRADNLAVGDVVVADGGSVKTIGQIERVGSMRKPVVYNLAVAASDEDSLSAHMLEANGVTTGDLYLQEKLAGPDQSVASEESPPTISEVRAAIDELFGVKKIRKTAAVSP